MLLLGNHLRILVATTRCGFRAKVYWAIGDSGGMKPRITRVARLGLVLIRKFDIPMVLVCVHTTRCSSSRSELDPSAIRYTSNGQAL